MIKTKAKIVVTGGAGFIGSHLSNRLSELKYSVYAIDNLSKGKKENLNQKINFFEEDITSKNFQSLLKKINPDIIYHFAAQASVSQSNKNPQEDFQINLLATQQLVDIATSLKIHKIIFASSAAVYGEVNKLPVTEEVPKNPISVYGITKLTSEYLFRINFKNHKIPYVCLRYANVYGENQDSLAEGGVVAIFINKILKGELVTINGDGNQTRDFIHVSDITTANIEALKKKIIGEVNISTGTEISINGLYELIIKISKKQGRKLHKPLLNIEVKKSALSFQKFNKSTGWFPQISLETGLRRTYEYFNNQ